MLLLCLLQALAIARGRQTCPRRLLPVLSLVLAVALLVGGFGAASGQHGIDPRIAPGGITLKQALEKGLKARRPSEFAFIRLVVDKVEEGRLPRQMVEKTFLYARKRQVRYPMPYFERALQIQARKIGVELPFTDT